MFKVINRITGETVSKDLKSSISARKVKDKKDTAYGAAVHIVKPQ